MAVDEVVDAAEVVKNVRGFFCKGFLEDMDNFFTHPVIKARNANMRGTYGDECKRSTPTDKLTMKEARREGVKHKPSLP